MRAAADGAEPVQHGHADLRPRLRRDDVRPRSTLHDSDVDRDAALVVVERVQADHLPRELLDRARALAAGRARMRRTAANVEPEAAEALAGGLQSTSR